MHREDWHLNVVIFKALLGEDGRVKPEARRHAPTNKTNKQLYRLGGRRTYQMQLSKKRGMD